jgi:hypothetical protein
MSLEKRLIDTGHKLADIGNKAMDKLANGISLAYHKLKKPFVYAGILATVVNSPASALASKVNPNKDGDGKATIQLIVSYAVLGNTLNKEQYASFFDSDYAHNALVLDKFTLDGTGFQFTTDPNKCIWLADTSESPLTEAHCGQTFNEFEIAVPTNGSKEYIIGVGNSNRVAGFYVGAQVASLGIDTGAPLGMKVANVASTVNGNTINIPHMVYQAHDNGQPTQSVSSAAFIALPTNQASRIIAGYNSRASGRNPGIKSDIHQGMILVNLDGEKDADGNLIYRMRSQGGALRVYQDGNDKGSLDTNVAAVYTASNGTLTEFTENEFDVVYTCTPAAVGFEDQFTTWEDGGYHAQPNHNTLEETFPDLVHVYCTSVPDAVIKSHTYQKLLRLIDQGEDVDVDPPADREVDQGE